MLLLLLMDFLSSFCDVIVLVKVVEFFLRGLDNIFGEVFLDFFFNFFIKLLYSEESGFK